MPPAERFFIEALFTTEANHAFARIGCSWKPLVGPLAGLFYLSAQRLEIERRFADFRAEGKDHGVHLGGRSHPKYNL